MGCAQLSHCAKLLDECNGVQYHRRQSLRTLRGGLRPLPLLPLLARGEFTGLPLPYRQLCDAHSHHHYRCMLSQPRRLHELQPSSLVPHSLFPYSHVSYCPVLQTGRGMRPPVVQTSISCQVRTTYRPQPVRYRSARFQAVLFMAGRRSYPITLPHRLQST